MLSFSSSVVFTHASSLWGISCDRDLRTWSACLPERRNVVQREAPGPITKARISSSTTQALTLTLRHSICGLTTGRWAALHPVHCLKTKNA